VIRQKLPPDFTVTIDDKGPRELNRVTQREAFSSHEAAPSPTAILAPRPLLTKPWHPSTLQKHDGSVHAIGSVTRYSFLILVTG